ncbi:hypothetical protein DPMN_106575 [Dreissena polymorpha]|uniref:Uncharacterized protein n=1 Tax=Dreissena polymorpha TaxID=45954 RepID=A0A9D4K573_DREPO|nr:hypothetical protein DPMN_106575 [Dreissena polymorpha]
MMSPMEIDVIREFMFDNINQMQESHSNGGPGAARKVRLVWEQLTEKANAVGNQRPHTTLGEGVRSP